MSAPVQALRFPGEGLHKAWADVPIYYVHQTREVLWAVQNPFENCHASRAARRACFCDADSSAYNQSTCQQSFPVHRNYVQVLDKNALALGRIFTKIFGAVDFPAWMDAWLRINKSCHPVCRKRLYVECISSGLQKISKQSSPNM